MPQTLFRNVGSEDFPAVRSLLRQLGYDLDAHTVAKNVREIQKRGGEVFVAEQNGRIIGCVAAIIDVRLAEGLCGEIVSLVVAEPERGKGIGKGLVRHAELWLSQSVKKVRVTANAVREAAHKLYDSEGYQLEKTQKIFKKSL